MIIKKGFVLLYAVLLVSIVLTVSLSLFDISYRQIVLSSTVESAQRSFYIADWVRECIKSFDNFDSTNPYSLYNYFGKFYSNNTLIYIPNNGAIPPTQISELDCNADSSPNAPNYNGNNLQVVSTYNFLIDGNSVGVIINKKVEPIGTLKTEEFIVTSTYGNGSRQVQTVLFSQY